MTEPIEPVTPEEIPASELPIPGTSGYLEEDVGQKSAMRLMSLITCIGGVIICLIVAVCSLAGDVDTGTAMQAGTTLLGFAFGGKLLQKVTEK